MGWLQVFDTLGTCRRTHTQSRARIHTHTFCLFVSQVVRLSFSLSSVSLFRPLFWAPRKVRMFTVLFHDDFLSVSAVSFFCVSELFARVFMSGNHSYLFLLVSADTVHRHDIRRICWGAHRSKTKCFYHHNRPAWSSK